jgi:hypothetical protein
MLPCQAKPSARQESKHLIVQLHAKDLHGWIAGDNQHKFFPF